MSAQHHAPWRAEGRDNGKSGRLRREFWAVLDRNEFFVAEGLDETTAREIVAAVNERDDLVENLKTAHANRERESAEWVKLATDLKAERDRAVKYAEAAPHPGSASWKEMQAVYAERDRLSDALNEVCSRVSVALNCPRHETEAIDLLVHALLGIKECARAAIWEEAK